MLSLDAKATPYFSFCLSTRAAAIQTSVRLHTLFSGEPAEIQPFSTLLLLRPVCEQRAGRGGDFSFCSDLICPPPTEPRGDFLLVFFLFTRRPHFGVGKSTRRCCASHKSSAPCAAPPWQWIDFFSPPFPPADLCLVQVEKTVLPLTCGSPSLQLHVSPGHFKKYLLPDVSSHFRTLNFFFLFCARAFPGGGGFLGWDFLFLFFFYKGFLVLRRFSEGSRSLQRFICEKWWPSGELCRSSLSSVSP